MVDYGKILAFHNAGWDSAKIANEIRMTEGEYLDAVTDKLNEIDAQISKLEREYRMWVAIALV